VPNLVVKHWSKVIGFVTIHAAPTLPFRLSLRFFLRLTQKIHSHLCNQVAVTPDVDGKDTIAAKPAHDYTEPSMTSTIVKLGYAPDAACVEAVSGRPSNPWQDVRQHREWRSSEDRRR